MPEREISRSLQLLNSVLLHFQYVESIVIYQLIVTGCDDLYMFSQVFLNGSKYFPEVITRLADMAQSAN